MPDKWEYFMTNWENQKKEFEELYYNGTISMLTYAIFQKAEELVDEHIKLVEKQIQDFENTVSGSGG